MKKKRSLESRKGNVKSQKPSQTQTTHIKLEMKKIHHLETYDRDNRFQFVNVSGQSTKIIENINQTND